VLLTRALEKATAGERLTADEALALYTDAPMHVLGRCADGASSAETDRVPMSGIHGQLMRPG